MSLAADLPADLGYRHRVVVLLPAVALAYFMLIWPLIYARQYIPADLATGAVVAPAAPILNRLVFPVLAALAMALMVAERRRLGRFDLFGGLLVAGFLGYLGLTAAWSLVPGTTLSRLSLHLLLLISLAPAVLLAERLDDILKPMVWVAMAVLVVNVLSIAVIPSSRIGFPGIYSHKNTLGANAVIAGLFALYAVSRADHRMRLAGFVALPFTVLLLYLSQSKTSLGLLVLAPLAAVVAALARRYLRIALPILMVVLTVPAIFLLGGGVPGFDFRDLSMIISGDTTFTGRSELWTFALAHIAEKPWTGWGFQSFWGIGPASPAARMTDSFIGVAPHAHNGYLDMLLQGGGVALALFLSILLMIAWWIDKVADRDGPAGAFLAAVLFYILWQNLLETDWLQGMTPLNTLLLLLMVAAIARRNGRLLT
ncbi:MAG: putative exopolysaccharide production protein (ExoQ-like) [Proteobacteria bacterium]|nr:putative exopolysaccharide production protein (ExoQ-like) [Pseudomonadota bacterium]